MKILKDGFFLILGLTIVAWSLYAFLQRPAPARFQPKSDSRSVIIGDHRIPVGIADTEAARERGLSGRQSLEAGTGMLFLFDTPGLYGFWMKDMKFSIDIIWLSADWQVIGIEKEVSPQTFPGIFYPPALTKFVLEINSGEADKLGIEIGEAVLESRP